MSSHSPYPDDFDFRDGFETGLVPPSEFNHRAHLRIGFVHLCELPLDAALSRMKVALHAFLDRNGVPPEKYHETLTRSWLMALQFFMDKAAPATSFDGFLKQDDRLLDPQIMLTHYSSDTLFSDAARASFVTPDLQPIPPSP